METAETLDGSAAQRDGRGRWAPGQSGNPAGKPAGRRNDATILKALLRDEDIEGAARVIAEKIGESSLTAARFVFDRLDPKPKGRSFAFALDDPADLRQLLDAMLRALTLGEMSALEALDTMRFLDRRSEMVASLSARAAAAAPVAAPTEPAPEPMVEPTRDAAPAPAVEPAVAAAPAAVPPESHLNLQARKAAIGGVPPNLMGRPISARRLRRALAAQAAKASSAAVATAA